ncbi:MAG: 50S ribosomal protein L3 N(5)-glutamine methyltransferase [Pseudomonadota bacterium]|nr:50S ribosomal protein L3 N(5)-glutamine methyltransferase [Pseudomonadota bacterium]
MMDTRFELIDRCTTFNELLHDMELLLNKEHLFYGHGTGNAMDESMAILMYLSESNDVLDEEQLKTSISDQVQEKAKEVLYQRVAESKPLPYITNEAYFCGKKFYVDERVLIPRSPIAELINNRFEPWLNPNSINRVLEIGTGSGCIALSIAEAFSDIEVVATDISPDAIDVARLNTKAHGLEQQVEIIESDLFENVSGVFDLIITNPPYVPDKIMLDLPKEYLHEPHMALAAGEKGLDFISRILHDAPPFLTDNGIVIIEAGVASEHMEKGFNMPFIWIDFEIGGEGVALIEASHLKFD